MLCSSENTDFAKNSIGYCNCREHRDSSMNRSVDDINGEITEIKNHFSLPGDVCQCRKKVSQNYQNFNTP